MYPAGNRNENNNLQHGSNRYETKVEVPNGISTSKPAATFHSATVGCDKLTGTVPVTSLAFTANADPVPHCVIRDPEIGRDFLGYRRQGRVAGVRPGPLGQGTHYWRAKVKSVSSWMSFETL